MAAQLPRGSRAQRLLCLAALALLICTAHAGRVPGSRRQLVQVWSGRRSNANLAANTVRSQAATSQAILEATNSGANRYATTNAGRTGSMMTWAAAQGNQDVFDLVEQGSGPWPRGRKA